MKDFLSNEFVDKFVRVNIYADEIQPVKCHNTNEHWFYIGIIVENLDTPLLEDIIKLRYYNNFDKNSPYFSKNDRIIHWVDICDIDTKNIAKRWLEYILQPSKSENKFYAYVLGINNSKLNREEFNTSDEFNSKYNRFFRSAILYSLKCFFPNKKIIVENIFHEKGQQKDHKLFPWHCIYCISKQQGNIEFNCDKVQFLPKSHRENERSNLIQLCDLFLGLSKCLLHGLEESESSRYKKELIDMFLQLFHRMINEPYNKKSSYAHSNRIMIRFYPKNKTKHGSLERGLNQFYTKRKILYIEQKSNQMSFDF